MNKHKTCVYLGEPLARYGFGEEHPFGSQRHQAFQTELFNQELNQRIDIQEPVIADQKTIELFHTHEYTEKVRQQSESGTGYLDYGDTPAFTGMFKAACAVAGSVINGIDQLMRQQYKRAFIPIAGLHHARRDLAAGFCVFNDCGIAIDYLRHQYRINRIAYVDIDAHHGDGVFYSFEDEVDLLFADLHQDGRTLYPGTGHTEKTGKGHATGGKLNLPMPPGADDELFITTWPQVENYLKKNKPEFILFQCDADSILGDPITQMAYSPDAHIIATKSL